VVDGRLTELDEKFAGVLNEVIAETEFKVAKQATRVGGASPVRKVIW